MGVRKSAQLTPRQKRFCAALLTARTVAEAAAAVGLGPRQAFYYLESPAVRLELARLLDELQAQAVRLGASALAEAVLVLAAIQVDEEAPYMARIAAAKALLTHVPALRAESELQARLTALEAGYADTETGCD